MHIIRIINLLGIVFFCSGCLYFLSDQAYYDGVDKLRNKYLQEHPSLDASIKESILEGKIGIGMNKEQVKLIGNYRYPKKIKATNEYGADEMWIYYRSYNRAVQPYKSGGLLGLGGTDSSVKYFLVYENLYFKDNILIKTEEIETDKEY